ncbi:hypothetical protein DYB34_011972 [Aphanomyces astaci]|uniref:Uncharacterized protein n=1 Tax=Aphanomyces astaci TaxID=112090 RepID=A0A418BSV8_APHAT|nr:hypothetical protein DYB34_011972 [Aphanomyces astaci]
MLVLARSRTHSGCWSRLTTQSISWATVLIDHVAHLRLSRTKSDTHENGTNEEDRIDRALLLYNEDHPKGSDFEILNFSNIVRSVPILGSVKQEASDVKEVLAESQRHCAQTFELQTHISLFSANLDTMDENSNKFFASTRKRVLDELSKDADDSEV